MRRFLAGVLSVVALGGTPVTAQEPAADRLQDRGEGQPSDMFGTYINDAGSFEPGEYALEYLRRLSNRFRIYGGIEGTQDEQRLRRDLQATRLGAGDRCDVLHSNEVTHDSHACPFCAHNPSRDRIRRRA